MNPESRSDYFEIPGSPLAQRPGMTAQVPTLTVS
jgi:hypothetical protein